MNPKLDKVLSLPNYQKLLLLLLVCSVIFGLFWLVVYQPMGKELDRLQRQKGGLERKLAEDRRIADNLPKFRAEYEKLEKQLEVALRELPNKKEISSLLVGISSLAKNTGLEVVEFKPSAPVPQGFYAQVPVSLRLKGSFHEIAMFSYHVGNMTRIVNLSNLRMGNAKVEDGRNLLSVECKATTFQFIDTPVDKAKTGKRKGRK
ncbi:type IV pilus biogenesis protein PilO [Syntrophotalea carbinolica DSM 2380]|uniref:Type IV pilus biogenesis protein PilO n=1 Tax=Syntrophotalea carbinolica (strain DSM 2380 / NBRC 103641 / GraBd1) TaxID=338963 RepID=Q3A2N2_SYNC1|nr:type 4a pilus biogenesis protein PilO [Syntrophotalea carbinolica]ABA89375.1 type IV pilus biogenesis protein PilO [Syntrophotalea carbinolica DSM 2380]